MSVEIATGFFGVAQNPRLRIPDEKKFLPLHVVKVVIIAVQNFKNNSAIKALLVQNKCTGEQATE